MDSRKKQIVLGVVLILLVGAAAFVWLRPSNNAADEVGRSKADELQEAYEQEAGTASETETDAPLDLPPPSHGPVDFGG